jgi:hypothetical protein
MTLTLEANDWPDLEAQMRAMLALHGTPNTPGNVIFEVDNDKPEWSEPSRKPELGEALSAPTTKRSHKSKPTPVTMPEPEPQPEPTPAPPAKRELPPLDLLKQAITVAVRAAQKSEGPKTILELLPEFKRETGLDFVMNAQEEHREALRDLVEAAGLQPA